MQDLWIDIFLQLFFTIVKLLDQLLGLQYEFQMLPFFLFMAEIFSVHAIKLSTLETFTLPTERLTKFSAPLSLSMPFCRSVFEGRVGRGRREGGVILMYIRISEEQKVSWWLNRIYLRGSFFSAQDI